MANDLHNAIMNLPIPMDPKIPADASAMLAYKLGHRDARHAAAELSLAPTAPPDRDAMGRLIGEASGGKVVWQYRSKLPSSEWHDCNLTECALYGRHPEDFEVRKLYAAPQQSASTNGAGEVVRQVKARVGASIWIGVSQDEYDRTTTEKRIVYRAAQPADGKGAGS